VLCWPALPLASALRSTDSAANRSALFAGFPATTASSDFPRPYIIGYSFSPSRCGPWGHLAIGQTRDLPVSDAILPRVMCSSTPAGWTAPRVAVLSMLRSTVEKVSAPSDKDISWLNHTPHAAVVYASWPSLPPAHATLTSRRLATPYLRWTSTSQSRQPPGAFPNFTNWQCISTFFGVRAPKKVSPINEAYPQILCSVDQVGFRSAECGVGYGPAHCHVRKVHRR